MRVAILYIFHNYNEHVRFFLRHGIIKNPMYEYFFIYQGSDDIAFPYPLLRRENIGYDFGGWSAQLFATGADDKLVKDSFDYFIFVNSSITGPFLPTYCKQQLQEWPMLFINLLNNTDVLLSGITINCDKWIYQGDLPAHVQSMLFCVNNDTLQYLIEHEIFHPTKFITDKNQLICDCEVRMSDLIFQKGGNIACLMKIYQNVDFRNGKIPIKSGDPWYNNGMLGDSLHPYETIFFKNNRGVSPGLLERYMRYHNDNAL